MKKSRFREEQIFGVLKEAGVPVGKLSRKLGTIDATSYRWRAQARRLRRTDL